MDPEMRKVSYKSAQEMRKNKKERIKNSWRFWQKYSQDDVSIAKENCCLCISKFLMPFFIRSVILIQRERYEKEKSEVEERER